MNILNKQSPVYPAASRVGLRDRRKSGWFNPSTSELLPGLVIKPGMKVVDVGCGDGGYITFCAKHGANVTFIDRQEDRINVLEDKLSELNSIDAQGIVSECDPIPMPDCYADLVICTEVLSYSCVLTEF